MLLECEKSTLDYELKVRYDTISFGLKLSRGLLSTMYELCRELMGMCMIKIFMGIGDRDGGWCEGSSEGF